MTQPACVRSQASSQPAIEFTKIPVSEEGGPSKYDLIAGRVSGAKPGQRVVLYAKGGVWWIQPFAVKPFTTIKPDSTWQASIHLGTEYAALLVESTYVPESTTRALPVAGGPILAVASVKGKGFIATTPVKPRSLRFSGYEWEVRQTPSARGGKDNPYDPENAWTDQKGFLHLRITPRGEQWACAEVRLTRSLGPGLYRFSVQDVSQLDPAAAVTLYTWDDGALEQYHREVDVEISRWGERAKKNAQYVVQPYYEPSNVSRFEAPPGLLTYSFRWEPGKIDFKTFRGRGGANEQAPIAEHAFSSGVPSPGGESVQLNLYAFGNTRIPMRRAAEVVVENFEFLP
jgi:hypothetical protein